MFIIVPSTQFSIDTLYVMHCYYMFRPTVAFIRYIQIFTFALYFCLLYLPTLASIYTLGECCPGMLALYILCVIKCINPLKAEFLRNNIHKSSPYLTGNTLLLRYKAQPVNAVWGNSRCLM
jgi:hypothetical protein